MHTRNKLFGLLWIATLATCFLALPSPAAAQSGGSDRTVPQGLSFLFDKDSYGTPVIQAGTGSSMAQKLSRLSVRLYGGLSYVMAGDINAGSDGYFELIDLYTATGSGTSTGGYSPLHIGLNTGADIIFQLNRNIGVGIGAGYMRSSRRSLMTFTDTDEVTLTAEPTISAIPIRLGVFLTFPLAGKINLTADVGGAYYAGLKFDAWQRVTFAAGDWYQNSLSASKSGNLGFQGSLGFEYMVSPKMGFFVEAVGRYARFGNFASATGTYETSDGTNDATLGKIYLVNLSFTGVGEFDWITLSETPPVVGGEITAFREPKFDLSGFTLQAGIRIRF